MKNGIRTNQTPQIDSVASKAEATLKNKKAFSEIEMIDNAMDNIDVVYELSEVRLRCGFGYYRGTGPLNGKLIEFRFRKDALGIGLTGCAGPSEITLKDSLEWLEKIDFACERTGEAIQTGSAWVSWLLDLRDAI